MGSFDRRSFLKQGLVVAGGLGLGITAWSHLVHHGKPPGAHPVFGPLETANDQTTGLPLLKLPRGFRYHSFAWAGEMLNDGFPSPGACDGMGVVSAEGGVVTLVRNHELRGSSGPIGNPQKAWDITGGGTCTLRFDTRTEQLVDSRISLAGTVNNCAGGVTPWGTWLSCEEAPFTPELIHLGGDLRQKFWHLKHAQKSHGYVFEVHPDGESDPRPITAMGQFYHEAAAVDPESGIVYMTEDTAPYAGFYRYSPDVPGELQAGGKLQMLKVLATRELTYEVPPNTPMVVDWVDIAEPGNGHSSGTHDGAGVVTQGIANGGTPFVSLEGCGYHQGSVYFTSKAGGQARAGQIFRFDIAQSSLEMVFEADEHDRFTGPDNIIFSPRGSLMICEDRLGTFTHAQYIAGLNEQDGLFAFCQTNPQIDGSYAGHNLGTTALGSEWAGVCFSADGQWMFANLYNPGITFAITGPWQDGPV
ncbi:MAG: alkaline phosphatase PhoX [Lysobacterales bacterium]